MNSSVSRSQSLLNASHEGGYYRSTDGEIVVPTPSYAVAFSEIEVRIASEW